MLRRESGNHRNPWDNGVLGSGGPRGAPPTAAPSAHGLTGPYTRGAPNLPKAMPALKRARTFPGRAGRRIGCREVGSSCTAEDSDFSISPSSGFLGEGRYVYEPRAPQGVRERIPYHRSRHPTDGGRPRAEALTILPHAIGREVSAAPQASLLPQSAACKNAKSSPPSGITGPMSSSKRGPRVTRHGDDANALPSASELQVGTKWFATRDEPSVDRAAVRSARSRIASRGRYPRRPSQTQCRRALSTRPAAESARSSSPACERSASACVTWFGITGEGPNSRRIPRVDAEHDARHTIPAQIVRTGRRTIYRLLAWRPDLPIFFRLLDAV